MQGIYFATAQGVSLGLHPLLGFGCYPPVSAYDQAICTEKESTVKRTFQPSNIKRVRVHGFRARMATPGGRAVINARRRKGRKRLAL